MLPTPTATGTTTNRKKAAEPSVPSQPLGRGLRHHHQLRHAPTMPERPDSTSPPRPRFVNRGASRTATARK